VGVHSKIRPGHLKSVLLRLQFAADPERKLYVQSFKETWEHLIGPVLKNRRSSNLPAGIYLLWYREYKRTGVGPHEYLERFAARLDQGDAS
jgi:hypothetical protein